MCFGNFILIYIKIFNALKFSSFLTLISFIWKDHFFFGVICLIYCILLYELRTFIELLVLGLLFEGKFSEIIYAF